MTILCIEDLIFLFPLRVSSIAFLSLNLASCPVRITNLYNNIALGFFLLPLCANIMRRLTIFSLERERSLTAVCGIELCGRKIGHSSPPSHPPISPSYPHPISLRVWARTYFLNPRVNAARRDNPYHFAVYYLTTHRVNMSELINFSAEQ